MHHIISQEIKSLDSNGIEQGCIMLLHVFCLYWGSKPLSSGKITVEFKLVEAADKISGIFMPLLL